MNKGHETRGPQPKRTKPNPSPEHYECPEGNVFIVISDKRHKIKVLLDSGSNKFLLNQNTAGTLKVPYNIRENPLKITPFNSEVSSRGGKYYSHTIQLEIGTNGHTMSVSCEIGEAGKHDMIIPFGWWHHEHQIKNVETLEKCGFEHTKGGEHVQAEGIADMFEWDETVALDEEARMIGTSGSTRQEEEEAEGLPELYWQNKEFFKNEKGEMLARR